MFSSPMLLPLSVVSDNRVSDVGIIVVTIVESCIGVSVDAFIPVTLETNSKDSSSYTVKPGNETKTMAYCQLSRQLSKQHLGLF